MINIIHTNFQYIKTKEWILRGLRRGFEFLGRPKFHGEERVASRSPITGIHESSRDTTRE